MVVVSISSSHGFFSAHSDETFVYPSIMNSYALINMLLIDATVVEKYASVIMPRWAEPRGIR